MRGDSAISPGEGLSVCGADAYEPRPLASASTSIRPFPPTPPKRSLPSLFAQPHEHQQRSDSVNGILHFSNLPLKSPAKPAML